MKTIKQLRKQIDKLDHALLKLLIERVKIVHQIKNYKKTNHESIYSPEREIQILTHLLRTNKDVFPKSSLLKIYNEIFSISRKLQEPLKIGFLGPEGTYSHQAAENIFGSQSLYCPLHSIKSIFSELDNNLIHYGLVPIENSTEGIIGLTLDMLIEYNHYIIQESYLEIENNIISKEKTLNQINTVYSHAQPLAQCRIFLENNLPKAKIIETPSTAIAAHICKSKKQAAAIASKKAAEMYHLNILAEKINDSINNYTRFFVIGKTPNTIKEKILYKTSLIIGLKDKPGALFSVLYPFSQHKINLTKIESRPTKKKPWEYIFFIEFMGSLKENKIVKAIKSIETLSTYLKILGSYPVAKETL